MSDLCSTTVDQFLSTLKSEFETRSLEDRCTIVTPFYYPDFAAIELYLEPVGNGIVLSDEGETLNMLFVNGLAVEKNKDLYKEAKQIAQAHGVELNNSTISVISNQNDVGEASQNLLSAIQAIAYLIYKRRSIERDTFEDEVEKLMISNEVKYDFNFMIRGQAKLQKVKFHVNSNRNILIEPVTAPSYQIARNKAALIAFKWVDIRQVNKNVRFITVVDDREQKWETVWSDDDARNTIVSYSDEVVRWEAEQNKFVNLLIG